MTHGPMTITFRFNGLSSVRGWLDDIYRLRVRRNGRRAGSTRGGGWMHAENTAREGGGRVKERHEGKRGQSVGKRNGDGGPP